MSENASHIVSRFKWDTSFDKKEKAYELQERLSSWSRLNMPKEIMDVFNRVCPPEQTWRIQTLEINLGAIDFNNLEFELAEKMSWQLLETLNDLVINGNSSGGHKIDILNEDSSHIQLISSFLIYGVMPWSYKRVDGTLNEILAYQLQNNRQNTIVMLREAGVTHENVRKRMAWQINEPNIIKIIGGLEPNNGAQIIDFSNEFKKIQVKGTIVQTSITDFKKNLWLWILNYLFTERGTVFNKIAFMKSNIRQMADHYNITYAELLAWIEEAVDKVCKRYYVKADFILTLNALLKEREILKINSTLPDENSVDFWAVLKRHFFHYSSRKSSVQKAEFNELVNSLSRQDKSKFAGLILSLGDNENLWLHAVNNLNYPSLTAIFSVLNAAQAPYLVEAISLLDSLCREINLGIERKVLWEIGIKFLNSHKNASFTGKEFLDYCIADLGKRNGILKEDILNQLTSARIPTSSKTVSALEIYTSLTAVFVSETSRQDSVFLAGHFQQLIDTLRRQFIARTIDKDLFVSLQRSLIKNIQLNPKAALKALTAYPHKNGLQKLISHIMDDGISALLVKNAANETSMALLQVQDILTELKTNREFDSLVALMEENLMVLGLNAIIFQPGAKGAKHLEFVLEELSKMVPTSQLEQFVWFIQRLTDDKKLRSLGLFKAAANKMLAKYGKDKGQFVLERVDKLMDTPVINRQEAGKRLMANFDDKGFIKVRAQKGNESGKILNYMLAGGGQLMEMLLNKYIGILTDELKQVSKNEITRLKELYWKCILNYSIHGGKSEALKTSFHAAVVFHFQISDKNPAVDLLPERFAGNKNSQLKNGDKISEREVMMLIEKYLATSSGAITHKGKKASLYELISIGLELNPAEFRKIIARTAISEKRIEAIKASISFDQFSLWIMSDTYGGMNEAIESLRSLYNLTGHITTNKISADIINNYWKQLWRIIKTGSISATGFKKLVNDSFQQVINSGQVNSDSIIAEINKENIRLTPALTSMLAEYIPVFSKLPANEIANIWSSKLLKCERSGLLYNLIFHIICKKQVPAWFGNPGEMDVKEMLNEVVVFYPVKFLLVLKRELIPEQQMRWLSHTLNFKELTSSIGKLNRPLQPLLGIIEKFYFSLGHISVSGISAKEMQLLLFKKLIKAWTNNNWKIISTQNIWNELVWDLCVKKGIQKKVFIQNIEKQKFQLPLSLQTSFEYLKNQDIAPVHPPIKVPTQKPILKLLQKKDKYVAPVVKESIEVRNAGLVLISSYVPMLFERLGLINDKKFTSEQAHLDAIHYLQFVATGLSNTEESLLPLNKVLCGLALSEPVHDSASIPDEQVKLMEELIEAMIGYWPAIGDCTIDGFRGNWLVRDGLLVELDERWELTIEKRAYDLLIHKSPFSFSIIKYPWMNKPLYVNWPY